MTEQEAFFENVMPLCETVFDITWEATDMIRRDELCIEDSRELFGTVFELAKQFESSTESLSDDYLGAITEFARRELMEHYR